MCSLSIDTGQQQRSLVPPSLVMMSALHSLKADTREDQMATGYLLLNRQSHTMPSSLGRCPEGNRTRVNQ